MSLINSFQLTVRKISETRGESLSEVVVGLRFLETNVVIDIIYISQHRCIARYVIGRIAGDVDCGEVGGKALVNWRGPLVNR